MPLSRPLPPRRCRAWCPALFAATACLPAPLAAQAGAWWSYRPLQRPPVPAPTDPTWPRNEVDYFVLARLQAAGLQPAPAAERTALIRRATFDLLGLPPTPDEVAAFVADAAPDAYERLVDRLLASPQYGVHWGRHWLDLVRFAETDSFERDNKKPEAWRYRDWVIDAFNQDLPWGRFLQLQLAGDELPAPAFADLVATGYYRLGVWDDEPTDREQAVYDDFDGIVDTTARAMLGVSMGCARCHDHKLDPITTADYYSFLAFFENLRPYKEHDGAGLDPDNYLAVVPVDGAAAAHAAALQRFADERRELAARARAAADAAYVALAASARVQLLGEADRALIAHFDCERLAAGSVASDRGSLAGEVQGRVEATDGCRGAGLRFSGDGRVVLPPLVRDSFTIAFRVRTTSPGRGRAGDLRWYTGDGLVDGEVDGDVRDFGVAWHDDGRVVAGTGDPEACVSSPPGLADGAWHHVAFTRDRASGGIALYVDGLCCGRAQGSKLPLDAPPRLCVGDLQPGGHGFHGDLDELSFYGRALAAEEVAAEALSLRGGIAAAAALARAAAGGGAGLAGYAALQRPQLATAAVLCARERGARPAESCVRVRGNVHARGAAVQPALPAVLQAAVPAVAPPADGRSSGRRSALAAWIAAPDNPLTWRVLANRLWQFHFGRGLCRTPNDLGRLGEPPTHPELLDWLACEVLARGQSLKAMHRLLLRSATFCMACAQDAASAQADPRNDHYWRFDRRRLFAEELRDAMLAVSGELNPQLGGPSVFPPMPAAVLATSSRPDEVWGRSPPDQAARRSVYVHQKRSLQDPLLAAFDLADPDASCPVRFSTVQPTQALILLDGEFAQARARAFATRLQQQAAGLRAQLERGIWLGVCRPPRAAEVDRLLRLADDLQREHGCSELEALARCCLVLFNMNEFVYLD